MIRRISVRAIIMHEGKLLCVRHKINGSDHVTDYWATPGGGVDDSEPLLPALHREMIEETGIPPIIGNLLYVQQFGEPEKDREYLEFFFHIANSQDYLNIDLSKTSHGALEIAEISFQDPAAINLLPVFLKEQWIDTDINAAGPTKFFSFLG